MLRLIELLEDYFSAVAEGRQPATAVQLAVFSGIALEELRELKAEFQRAVNGQAPMPRQEANSG